MGPSLMPLGSCTLAFCSWLGRISEEAIVHHLHQLGQLGSASHFPTLSPWPRAFSPSVTLQAQLQGSLAFCLYLCTIHLLIRASPTGPTPRLRVEDLLSISRTPQRAGAPWDLGPSIYLRADEGRPVPHRTRPWLYPTRMRDTVWWLFPEYFETLYFKTIVRDTPDSHSSCHRDLLMRERGPKTTKTAYLLFSSRWLLLGNKEK